MPLFDDDALLASVNSILDLLEAALPVWGKGRRHVHRVYYPPQEDMTG